MPTKTPSVSATESHRMASEEKDPGWDTASRESPSWPRLFGFSHCWNLACAAHQNLNELLHLIKSLFIFSFSDENVSKIQPNLQRNTKNASFAEALEI